MKNLIYDVVVGVAILIGLIAIVPIMKANQKYIANSNANKSNIERFETDYENTDFEKNSYTMTDVYALILQSVNDQGCIEEGITIKFNNSGVTLYFSSAYSAEAIQNNINTLSTYLNNPDQKYRITKTIVKNGDVVRKEYVIRKAS